jgi:hypothetical protein
LCVDHSADEIVAMRYGKAGRPETTSEADLLSSVEIWIENTFFNECFDPQAPTASS